jgi:hypothetical protein
MKSRIAFGFSIDSLPSAQCFLWTFTFRQALDVAYARKLWRSGMMALKRQASFCGIRVFELHPGGHGLHVHLVTPDWFDVRLVRRIWTGASTDFLGGRVHVAAKAKAEGHYIGKYLSKQGRPPCLKGARMWSTVGGYVGSKVRDIVRDCAMTRAFRAARELVAGFERLPFLRKRFFAKMLVENWIRSEVGATLIPMPQAI